MRRILGDGIVRGAARQQANEDGKIFVPRNDFLQSYRTDTYFRYVAGKIGIAFIGELLSWKNYRSRRSPLWIKRDILPAPNVLAHV